MKVGEVWGTDSSQKREERAEAGITRDFQHKGTEFTEIRNS